jgi:hypothetical protein
MPAPAPATVGPLYPGQPGRHRAGQRPGGRPPAWTADHSGSVLILQADSDAILQSRYGTPCQAWAYWQARRYCGPLLAGVLGAD